MVLQKQIINDIAAWEKNWYILQILSANRRTIYQIQSQRIRPIFVDDVHRIRIIFQSFAHFAAVGGQNQSVANQIFKRRPPKKGRAEDQQRIEPAPGLIDALCDEIRWKSFFKLTAIFERVMTLTVRHAPRFKPTIENLQMSFFYSVSC